MSGRILSRYFLLSKRTRCKLWELSTWSVQSCTWIPKGPCCLGCIFLYLVDGTRQCNKCSLLNKTSVVCKLDSSPVIHFSLCYSLSLFCATCEANLSHTQASMHLNGTFRILRTKFREVLAAVWAPVQSAALWISRCTSPVQDRHAVCRAVDMVPGCVCRSRSMASSDLGELFPAPVQNVQGTGLCCKSWTLSPMGKRRKSVYYAVRCTGVE